MLSRAIMAAVQRRRGVYDGASPPIETVIDLYDHEIGVAGYDDTFAWFSSEGFIMGKVPTAAFTATCRFAVPSGGIVSTATVTAATLSMHAHITGLVGSPSVSFSAEDALNPAVGGAGHLPKDMPKTSATVGPVTGWVANVEKQFSVQSIIAELVAKGYMETDTHFINVIISDAKGGTGETHQFQQHPNAGKVPQLAITYTVPA
jgi:hypothetical protein